mmetsp:Transcript_82493/g.238285  ORF Transcript_82493/g.238285 Transcript_82493/m.238285 type:complete len:459 (+) Transcript_82493:792-2168(+)
MADSRYFTSNTSDALAAQLMCTKLSTRASIFTELLQAESWLRRSKASMRSATVVSISSFFSWWSTPGLFSKTALYSSRPKCPVEFWAQSLNRLVNAIEKCARKSSSAWILCCSSALCAAAKEWLTVLVSKLSIVKKHSMMYKRMKTPTIIVGTTFDSTVAISSHPERVITVNSVCIARPTEPNHSSILCVSSSHMYAFWPIKEVSRAAVTKLMMTTTAAIHKTEENADIMPQVVDFSSLHTRKRRRTRSARVKRNTDNSVTVIDDAPGCMRKNGKTTSRTPDSARTVSNMFQWSPQKPRLPPKSHMRNSSSSRKNAAKKNSHEVYAPYLRCLEPLLRFSVSWRSMSAFVRERSCFSKLSFSSESASMPCRTRSRMLSSLELGTPMRSMSVCRPPHCGEPVPKMPRSASKPIRTAFAQIIMATTKLKHLLRVKARHQRRPRGAASPADGGWPLPLSRGS